jgi:transposase
MIRQEYGKEALGCSTVFKWHERFAEGRASLEDDEHAGQPRTVRAELKIQEVATFMCANRSQMVMMSQEEQQQQGLAMVLSAKFCLMT